MKKVPALHWQRTLWAVFIGVLAFGGLAYVTLRDRFGEWPLQAVTAPLDEPRLKEAAPGFDSAPANAAPIDPLSSMESESQRRPPDQPPARPAKAPQMRSPNGVSLPLGAPDIDAVRAEVDSNPHATAPSLLTFATEVARAQAEAEATPERLQDFAAELSACALEPSNRMPPPVRSFCVRRYRTLAQRDPKTFAASYASLLSSLPPDLAERARQKDFP